MRRLAAAILICMATGLPAGAGQTYDLFFRSGTLTAPDGTALDDRLSYDGRLTGPTAISGNESYGVTIGRAPDGNTGITLTEGGRNRMLGTYDTKAGNPVIMYFLESTLRQMSQVSGGNPYYIRNRIKEALLAEAAVEPVTFRIGGQEIAAQRVTIQPFAKDAARDRMGPFADLALSVTVAKAIPGWYGRIEARTPADVPGAFSNELTLSQVEPEAPTE